MQCLVCAGEAKDLTPQNFDGYVIGCPSCGNYEVAGGAWDRLQNASQQERAAALAKAESLKGFARWPTMKKRIDEYQARSANPFVAAERGYIDEVILPRGTRKRLARALQMLRNKHVENPWKKHEQHPAVRCRCSPGLFLHFLSRRNRMAGAGLVDGVDRPEIRCRQGV